MSLVRLSAQEPMPDPELGLALDCLVSRVESTLRECGDAYPYYADPQTGRWFTTPEGNWCGGHWVAMLWMAWDITKDHQFREAALARTEPLRARLPDHDMFRSTIFYYAGARAWEIARLDRQRELALTAARVMAEMYDTRMRQIPIGDEPRVLSFGRAPKGRWISAVDNLYAALILLWWAWRETGEERYREIATAHADRTIELFIRPDGSTDEFIEFDPASGEPRLRFTRLGWADDSCWSRGQAWCIAGFTLAWDVTGQRRYLDATTRTLRYFLDGSPEDDVPYYDFTDPRIPDVERDSSAAAIVSAALLPLALRSDLGPQAAELAAIGRSITRSLVRRYLTPLGADDRRPPGMLLQGCFNLPRGIATNNELLWGDFYLMDGLWRLHRAGAL